MNNYKTVKSNKQVDLWTLSNITPKPYLETVNYCCNELHVTCDRVPESVFDKGFNQVLHYRLHCSCFISLPSVCTSLFMFYFLSFSLRSISFNLSTIVHLIHIYHIFWTHITPSFNLIVSFTFQPIPSPEINDLKCLQIKF